MRFVSEICGLPTTTRGIHESVLRSHAIVQKVKELLADGTPGKVVLELIVEMESAPQKSLEES